MVVRFHVDGNEPTILPFFLHFLEYLNQELELFGEFLAGGSSNGRQFRLQLIQILSYSFTFSLDMARRPHSIELDIGFLDIFTQPSRPRPHIHFLLVAVHDCQKPLLPLDLALIFVISHVKKQLMKLAYLQRNMELNKHVIELVHAEDG